MAADEAGRMTFCCAMVFVVFCWRSVYSCGIFDVSSPFQGCSQNLLMDPWSATLCVLIENFVRVRCGIVSRRIKGIQCQVKSSASREAEWVISFTITHNLIIDSTLGHDEQVTLTLNNLKPGWHELFRCRDDLMESRVGQIDS